MKRKLLRIFLVFLILTAFIIPFSIQTQASVVNLLANPSFETGGSPPSGWSVTGGAWTRSTTQVQSGNYSLYIINGGESTCTQDITVVVGHAYTVGYWIYTANSNAATVILKEGASETWPTPYYDVPTVPAYWHYKTLTRTATTTTMTIEIFMSAGVQSAYWDNLVFAEGSSLPFYSSEPQQSANNIASSLIPIIAICIVLVGITSYLVTGSLTIAVLVLLGIFIVIGLAFMPSIATGLSGL